MSLTCLSYTTTTVSDADRFNNTSRSSNSNTITHARYLSLVLTIFLLLKCLKERIILREKKKPVDSDVTLNPQRLYSDSSRFMFQQTDANKKRLLTRHVKHKDNEAVRLSGFDLFFAN